MLRNSLLTYFCDFWSIYMCTKSVHCFSLFILYIWWLSSYLILEESSNVLFITFSLIFEVFVVRFGCRIYFTYCLPFMYTSCMVTAFRMWGREWMDDVSGLHPELLGRSDWMPPLYLQKSPNSRQFMVYMEVVAWECDSYLCSRSRVGRSLPLRWYTWSTPPITITCNV